MTVAIGWTNYLIPAASGWYLVEDNQCKRLIFPEVDTLLPLYGYAIGNDGTEVYPKGKNSINFCIKRADKFDDQNPIACKLVEVAVSSAAGKEEKLFQWQIFKEIPINENSNLTDNEWYIRN